MRSRLFSAIALTAFVSACGGGGATNPPPGLAIPTPTPSPTRTPAASHLYVGKGNAPGGVLQYDLPLAPSSTPNFMIPWNPAVTVAVDASGDLAAGDDVGDLAFFAAPLSAASTPSAAFKNGTYAYNGQAAFTSAGDLWVGSVGRVNEFKRPFGNGSTPAAFVSALDAPGTVFDAAQNLYVSNSGISTGPPSCSSGGAGLCSDIEVYSPPYTGPPIVTADIWGRVYRHIAVSATQLFVTSHAGGGPVDVFALPITAGSTPAFSITNGLYTPQGIALDPFGNLYVANSGDATISVYSPPFSSTSAPSLIYNVGSGFALYGIAIGK